MLEQAQSPVVLLVLQTGTAEAREQKGDDALRTDLPPRPAPCCRMHGGEKTGAQSIRGENRSKGQLSELGTPLQIPTSQRRHSNPPNASPYLAATPCRGQGGQGGRL